MYSYCTAHSIQEVIWAPAYQFRMDAPYLQYLLFSFGHGRGHGRHGRQPNWTKGHSYMWIYFHHTFENITKHMLWDHSHGIWFSRKIWNLVLSMQHPYKNYPEQVVVYPYNKERQLLIIKTCSSIDKPADHPTSLINAHVCHSCKE